MIQSNDTNIKGILDEIDCGKTQLPDFQRGWVWEDNRIRALIASISNGYPIGAAMFLDATGNNVRFKSRLFEGVDKQYESVVPNTLVLDGQQRTTSMYRALFCKKVVETTDDKKKPIKRFYYIHIPTSLDTLTDRIDAIISVPEDRIIRENIGRDIRLDLSTPEQEYKEMYFPLNIIFDSAATMKWQRQFSRYYNSDETDSIWDSFYDKIVTPMMSYRMPVIKLGNDVPKEAVCQVFENVNQGGVSLTVFELITATFAADNFELRKDWDSIWAELRKQNVLQFKGNQPAFTGTDFLTAITLYNSYKQYKAGKRASISCKKKDVLGLQLSEYKSCRDAVLEGIGEAVNFIQNKCHIYTSVDLPYTSQLIPLVVVFAIDKNLWFNNKNSSKLSRWYWCGVFGELYGGANETRYVMDVQGLMKWVNDDEDLPDTVIRSNFYASRLQQLKTRNSAAYKGVMALILKNHCKDFISGDEMDYASYASEATDIHHIFPSHFCESMNYDEKKWNSVINKTPIYARTNRIIGGVAPSKYISSIERNHGVKSNDLDAFLASHLIDVESIRKDDFDSYYRERTKSLIALIEKATSKPIAGQLDAKE